MTSPHDISEAPTLVRESGEPVTDPGGLALTAPSLVMLRTLGTGGMGVVQLALQTKLHREVAVKTARDHHGDPKAAHALREEALLTAALQHPNIVPVYSVDESAEGEPRIVMMPVEGIAWSELLRGRLPLPEEGRADPLRWHLELLAQVANAIEYAHSRRILHRDLKPENVMIGRFGAVYVLDWGIAVSLREEDRGVLPLAREAKGVCGTPRYMAPEMTTGVGSELGTHTDVYLLGAVLHELVTGQAPHAAATTVHEAMLLARTSTPHPYPPSVPAELAAMCRQAMARHPAERFTSAEQFRASLLAYLRHRKSIELSDEAASRVGRLSTLVGGVASAEDERLVRDLFAEARFGFQQALRDWPENAAAQQGATGAVHLIVGYELKRRNLDAARSYLALLENPPAELRDGLQKLKLELEAERENYRRLKKQVREADRTLGNQWRALAAILFGVGAGGSLLVIDWGDQSGVMPLTRSGYVGWLVVLSLSTAFAIFLFRKTLMSNEVNRQIVYGTIAVITALVATRFTIYLSDLPVRLGFRIELIVYALGFAMLAVVSNYRVFVAALICGFGAVADAAIGTPRLYVIALCTLLSFAAMSWGWRGRRSKRSRLL